MLVSKNIRASAASTFLRHPGHSVSLQKSPYSLPLHLVHLRPPASQFQRRTQHCCHCIDNNTENLPPMHSQLFSTPADQQHSPAWKRQPFRSRRYQRTHLSDKPRLQSEDHRHPCIHPQHPEDMPPEWPVLLRSALCFRPEYKNSHFAQLPLSVQSFACSELLLLLPLGQQPVSAVSVNAPPKSKTARLEIFLMVKHILSDSILYSRGSPPFLVYCNTPPPGSICIHAGFNPFRARCEK